MMNKSNRKLTLSTSIFVLISFFIMPMNVVNAGDSVPGIIKSQACDLILADEKKDGDKKDDKKDGEEEEPDCE